MVNETDKSRMVRNDSADCRMVYVGAEIDKALQLKLQRIKLTEGEGGQNVTQCDLIIEALEEFVKNRGL